MESLIAISRELSEEVWRAIAQRQCERASQWTAPYRERRASGKLHPVYDFLFVYYRVRPTQLEAWHPQWGITLLEASQETLYQHRYYRHDAHGTTLDPSRLEPRAIHRLEMALRLCETVYQRPPQFGCFGMHEWAMVYRGDSEGEVRHAERLPLRLSQEETDAFVRSQPIACSHSDAFRFFSEAAKPFNRIQPTKETRIKNEQCGCLHTNMDLYKICGQCMPWMGSDLMWRCFEFAVEARILDMRASPYDCLSLGFDPIPIETPTGRAEYERIQRNLHEQAQPLRKEIIDCLQKVLGEVKG
ncbi:3-methyladenine DNA glycosylase [Puniceicoccus vermicola]|uniref:3-methyladenine DNA glycosylase n=1 Tax=Puniceicoccus vermicola TaxID=388746 RepID=A0A7X1AVX4_9BACT|nr:3-methyladenine DNA glycosylase [Puniceicoccus vermicola]MBC2600759.1 3-methyladenine DNA glycosylase [Puniceicoccus vermicola]